jgi:PKD repeat protein
MKKLSFIFIMVLTAFRFNAQNHYIVTSVNDPANPFNTVSGELRYAIEQANTNPGLDYIDFQISGTVPAIIQLQSQLPDITDAIVIDGSTQPANGYTGSDPKIAIKGDINNTFIGFILTLRNASSSGSQIKNLKLFDCSYLTFYLNASDNNIVQNCIINTSNSFGMVVTQDCDNNVFKGNIFGTDLSFSLNPALANQGGIRLEGGGTAASNPDNNIFGGLLPGELNYFYNMPNAAAPLDIQNGVNNRVTGNLFVNNAKNIDLYTNVSCNGSCGTGGLCTGGNNCKAYPIFQTANTNIVSGTSAPNDFIEIYLSNSTGIDAVQLLGTVTADGSGQWTTTIAGLNPGDKIIATATDVNGNTSEFSPPQTIEAPCCNNTFALTYTGGVNCFSQFTLQKACLSTVSNHMTSGANITTCVGESMGLAVYQNNSCGCINGLQYSWDFGDGYTTTGTSATHNYASAGNYTITVTASSSTSGVCIPETFTATVAVNSNCCSPGNVSINAFSTHSKLGPYCISDPIHCNINGGNCWFDPLNTTFQWNYGDGFTASTTTSSHAYTTAGTYTITLTINNSNACSSNPITTYTTSVQIIDCPGFVPCQDCIGSFAPPPGDYIVSVWVREDQPTYVDFYSSGIGITFKDGSNNTIGSTLVYDGTTPPVYKLIDGWQKIEQKFTIPSSTATLNITLFNGATTADAYFDDIRIHPFNSSFKSYVYDPITLRLMAELDENNYATYYEYDEDGALIRVKKETERGIKTIKEARNNVKK